MWFDWKKKKIEIRVCCFSCVIYMVCLINNGGIENRILIECNRTDLRDNYAIPFTDDYISDTGSDYCWIGSGWWTLLQWIASVILFYWVESL